MMEKPYEIHNEDCITGMSRLKDNSVGLLITSIPFADKYTYSNSESDVGNCQDHDGEFWTHMQYMLPEIMRIMEPGRLTMWHIQDLRSYKGKHGNQGLRDISGMLVRNLEEAGFWYQSKWMIRKDPPTQMRRTNAQHLLYCQLKRNSLFSFPALPDYILAFRKPGDPEKPVHLFTEQCQEDFPTCPKCGKELNFEMYENGDECGWCRAPLPDHSDNAKSPFENLVRLKDWQRWAESFWFDCIWPDIRMTNVLENAKEGKDEKHICPMQLSAIDRIIRMYSNEGDTIIDPFMGIGSVGYETIQSNRKFIGYELKESYFNQAQRWCLSAADANKQLEMAT